MQAIIEDQLKSALQAWDQLSSRDRLALKLLAVVLAVAFIYLVIWKPITGFKNSAQSRYESANELLAMVSSQKAQGGRAGAGRFKGSLVSLVTRSSQQNKLTISRYEPKNNNSMRVWFESAQFNALMRWLNVLNQTHGIQVNDITIEQGKASGLVRANVVLEK